MRLVYRLEVADLLAARTHLLVAWQSRRKRAILQFLLYVLVGLAIGFGLGGLHHLRATTNHALTAVWLLLVVSWIATLVWRRRNAAVTAWLAQYAGEYELVSSPEGLSLKAGEYRQFFAWRHVLALEEASHYWLIYVGRRAAVTIPKSVPAKPLIEDIRHQWTACSPLPGAILPDQPPLQSFGAWLRRVGGNVKAGICLACGRPVEPYRFTVGVGMLLSLVFLEFGISLLFDYQNSLPEPRFNIYGVTDYATKLLLFMLSGFVVAACVLQKSTAARLLVVMMSGTLFVNIVYLIIYAGFAHTPPVFPNWVFSSLYYGAITWVVVIAYRAVRYMYRLPLPFAWMVASGFIYLGVLLPSQYLPHQDLFYPDEEPGFYAKTANLDIENIYYQQPRLVGDALSRLSKETKGQTDLFFVGFAGQADEKVFAHEVNYVQQLFDSRFGTDGHSLAMVNSLDTLSTLPLANTHNLEQVLLGLGERMNKEEDVLFLFLTSHGSRDFKLSVSFWPLGMQDLPAAKLRELLDQSGIRNRVIVVSACYSGGFVDALKDENTLVMTAASRDRTSFGCGADRDFTYFGDAYFVKSLSKGNSFIAAFDEARELIGAREKQEGKMPSQPQIYVGSAIREKLQALESAKAM